MLVPHICLPLFGIGLTEGIVIIVAILILFGSTRLPKLGKGIGEGIRNFKNGLKGDSDNSSESDESKKADHTDDETP